jgi:hypothetical protein
VDEAEAFEENARQQFLEMSQLQGHDPEASLAVVRDATILDLSSISGLSCDDVGLQLESSNGDVAASYVATFCMANSSSDPRLANRCRQAGFLELSRRRQRRSNLDESRSALDTSHRRGPSEAYAELAQRIPLASQLGYGYRVDTTGVHLPPFPGRAVHTVRRTRARDDLADFVVDDHDSDNQQDDDAVPAGTLATRQRLDSSGSDDDRSNTSADSSGTGSSSPNSAGGRSGSNSESDSGDESGSGDDSAGSGGSERQEEDGRRARPPPSPASHSDGALSEERLAAILEKLFTSTKTTKSGGNNGLLAPKPNFWTLGSAPHGGYHLDTFTRLYREFKEFREIYGKHTGVTFRKLIASDISPLIRDDLDIARSDWKKISDSKLISKLKTRLGYQDSDHYIALLESCPKLPDKLKDTAALSSAFKDLAGKMLEIIDRARRHRVHLRKASLKHVFVTAIRSSYRMTNWFHLELFKSIGTSVRFLNTKIKARLSHELERKHEQAQDANFAGVRGQIGGGTQEGSTAPDRRPKRKDDRPRGGISKDGSKGSKDKSPFGKLSSEDYRKKMDELYKIENKLQQGRHFHEQTAFCDSNPCPFKRCQGCGEHSVKGKSAHDRPHCPHRKHKDFVAEGYFHEKWPGRLSIFARGDNSAQHSDKQTLPRSNNAGRFNSVASSDNKQDS